MTKPTRIKDIRLSRPNAARENFDALPPGDIPREGLSLDLIKISYGSPDANRMKIDVCEYDENSNAVSMNVLQTSALHENIDVRVDLSYPCTSVFFALFNFPYIRVDTTARFLAADGTILKEHVWKPGGEEVDLLFDYIGEKPATHFTVTGGPDLFIDNVDLTVPADPQPGSIVKNGDFELGEAFWTLAGEAYVAGASNPPGTQQLTLGPAPLEDSSAAQRVTLGAAGKYMLIFGIKNGFLEPLPPRVGEVSLGKHTMDFSQAGATVLTMVFLFEISEDEALTEQVLRIAKLQNDEPIPEFWHIDNVQLILVP